VKEMKGKKELGLQRRRGKSSWRCY